MSNVLRYRDFTKLKGQRGWELWEDLCLLQTAVENNPAMNENDQRVSALLVYSMLLQGDDVTAAPHSQISRFLGLSVGQVRRSLNKLKAANHIAAIQPSRAELSAGGWTLKYKAERQRRDVPSEFGLAAA